MKEKKTSDFIGAIVGNVIGLAFVNTVALWRQSTGGIILDSWSEVLWAWNLSLAVQVAGNLFLAFYRPARLRSFVKAVFAATSIVSSLVFFVVFPLDFSRAVGTWLNTTFRVLTGLGVFGSAVGLIVNLIRTATGTRSIADKND
jgi:hypothetical protein